MAKKSNKSKNSPKIGAHNTAAKGNVTETLKLNQETTTAGKEYNGELSLQEYPVLVKCLKLLPFFSAAEIQEFEELVKKHSPQSNNVNVDVKATLSQLKSKFVDLVQSVIQPKALKDKLPGEKDPKKYRKSQIATSKDVIANESAGSVSQEEVLVSLVRNVIKDDIKDQRVTAVVSLLQAEEKQGSFSLVSSFAKLPVFTSLPLDADKSKFFPQENISHKEGTSTGNGSTAEKPEFDDSDFENIELRTHVICPKGGIAFYNRSLLNEEEKAALFSAPEDTHSENVLIEASQEKAHIPAPMSASIPQLKPSVNYSVAQPAKFPGMVQRPNTSQQPPYACGPPPMPHFNQMAPLPMLHGPIPPHLVPNASQPPFPNMPPPVSFPLQVHPGINYSHPQGPNVPTQGNVPNQNYGGMPHAPPEHMMNLYQHPYPPPYNNFNPNSYPQGYPPNFQNQGPPPNMYPPHHGGPFNHLPYPNHHGFPPQGMHLNGPPGPHQGLPPHNMININQRQPVKVTITNPNKAN